MQRGTHRASPAYGLCTQGRYAEFWSLITPLPPFLPQEGLALWRVLGGARLGSGAATLIWVALTCRSGAWVVDLPARPC